MSWRMGKLSQNWEISYNYGKPDVWCYCAESLGAPAPQGSNQMRSIQYTYCSLQLLDKRFLQPTDSFVIHIVEPVCVRSSFWLCLKVTESRSEAAQLASRTLRHCSSFFSSPSSSPLLCHLYSIPCPVFCALVYRKRTKTVGTLCLFSNCSGEVHATW